MPSPGDADSGLATRMSAFLAQSRTLRAGRSNSGVPSDVAGRVQRLTRFFAAARGRHRRLRPAIAVTPRLPAPAVLSAVFDRLRQPLERARTAGRFVNPWVLAGIGRDEVRNVAVLAGLWTPALTGSAGRLFLAAFLDRLRDRGADVPVTGASPAYTVRTEHCLTGDAENRMDLTIDGEGFLIVIEAKVGAAFGADQRDRYLAALTRWQAQRGRPATLIVLTVARLPAHPGMVSACWADVARAARASLPPRARRGHTHHLIDQFARHIRAFGE